MEINLTKLIKYITIIVLIGELEMKQKKIIRDKLEKLIGQEVVVYVDRPLGSVHPKHQNIIYPVNYGYIKDIVALDGDYQDAYILGTDVPVISIKGKVYAIVEREDDLEDKLIVLVGEHEYTIEEIREKISFQEQYFKSNIKR
jgi:inorganic pyrophosphatase